MDCLEDLSICTGTNDRLIARLSIVDRVRLGKLFREGGTWLGTSQDLWLLLWFWRSLATALGTEILSSITSPSFIAMFETTVVSSHVAWISSFTKATGFPKLSAVDPPSISVPVAWPIAVAIPIPVTIATIETCVGLELRWRRAS